MLIKIERLIVALTALSVIDLTSSAPRTWPYMKTYDIWETNTTADRPKVVYSSHSEVVEGNLVDREETSVKGERRRKAKVINFFSLPADDECLSDDGRRIGTCMNVYECRIQGGTSRGDCALGFGACCVFESTCDQEVNNNITYFVSPKFPALMPHDKENCSIKIKLVSNDVSQIRLDFLHFTLGQPNRMSGACENDVFSIEGGINPFVLCGQNSGQHIFYDIGSPKGRAESQELKINVNLSKRSLSSRLWEIRISQIPFGSKAPTGCLQHFTGVEGIIQTFNFAENGRHLANQNYRSCVRQEQGRCSIQYEPCDDQSFRIGPMRRVGMPSGAQGSVVGPGAATGSAPGTGGAGTLGNPPVLNDPVLNDETFGDETLQDDDTQLADESMIDEETQPADGVNNPDNDLTPMNPAADGANGDAGTNPANNPAANNPAAANDPAAADDPALADEPAEDAPQQDETQQDEGSGGGGFFGGFPSFPSFPSLPSLPSFSFPSFFRTFSSRQSRQLYSTCTDRITLPCIVEDFIETGFGDIPTCTPVHCGNSLCRAGVASCKLETSVTPFHIGVHFGDGRSNKGSPEDNIGACLRYKQLPCS